MTEHELAALEALANAATPGPWAQGEKTYDFDVIATVVAPGSHGAEIAQVPTEFSVYPSGAWITVDGEVTNMAYIAAMHPQTALGLIAEVRRLREVCEYVAREGFLPKGWDNP